RSGSGRRGGQSIRSFGSSSQVRHSSADSRIQDSGASDQQASVQDAVGRGARRLCQCWAIAHRPVSTHWPPPSARRWPADCYQRFPNGAGQVHASSGAEGEPPQAAVRKNEEIWMITLKTNGKSHRVAAPPDMPLLWVLRDLLGMNGTKFGCGVALCGACTVHLDGIPRRSCVMPVSAAVGHAVTTIEA